MKKFFIYFTLVFALIFTSFAQERIVYNGSGNYELVERTDLRRYDNGRYIGLVSREVSSFIIPVSDDDGYLYDGTFWINENTVHNGMYVMPGFEDGIPSSFKISSDGKFTMIEDNGFPSFRSFPTFPDTPIRKGDSWEGQAVRAVDPLYKGVVTRMPIAIRYTYTNDSVFNGEEVFVIKAEWATRYGIGTGSYNMDFGGDKDLKRATGSHKANIYVSKETGNSVLIQDQVDETFIYNDGNQIRFKGTVSQFTKYPPSVDRMKFLPALKRVANLTDEEVENLKTPAKEFPKYETGDGEVIGDTEDKNDNKDFGTEELGSERVDIALQDEDNDDGGIYGDGIYGDGMYGMDDSIWERIDADISDYEREDDSYSGNSSLSGSKNNESNSKDSKEDKEGISSSNISSSSSSSLKGDEENNKGSFKEEIEKKIEEASKDKSSKDINTSKKEDSKEINIKVDNTPAGVRLTMENLQFLPDSAQLIPGQLKKLDDIAEVLRSVPGGFFLIEGHTASTGYPEGEKKLSIERAEAMIKEFTRRGLNASQFICKGSGGTKPIADNSTSSGKAKNRRVEITILN